MSRHASLDTPRAAWATILLFAYNGVIVGVYASSIAILRAKLDIDTWRLALLFIVVGIAAVTSMQIVGRLADRHGARRICLVMILPLIVAAIGFSTAPTYPLLLVAGVFLGTGNGGIDVAMNALAVQVERHRLDRGRGPVMSFFHGMWAVGSFVGSLCISVVGTAIGLTPNHTLLVVALTAAGLGVFALVAAYFIVPETEKTEVSADHGGAKVSVPRAAYLMGLMAIAFGLGEGTASDWAGTHVREVAGVDPRAAAWAVTALTACMVVIRLTGDLLVTKIGRLNLVRIGGAVAAIGYLVAAIASPFPMLLVGWGLVGLGIGVVAPQVYAAAGHLAGARGLAVVVTFGYTTFLMGPALTGGLISLLGIQHAMVVPAVLLLGLIPLSGITMKDGARERNRGEDAGTGVAAGHEAAAGHGADAGHEADVGYEDGSPGPWDAPRAGDH